MNWKEIFAILESKTDGKVYRAGGSVEFDELPEPGEDHLGYVYNVTDAFETTADFVEGAGISYPAGTNVIIVDVGTESEPVYKYDVLSGLYEVDDQMSDVSENPVQNKVVKAAIEEAAASEEITTTATGSDLTLSTSSGNINALTVFGKSKAVNGSIKSAGEGWTTVDLGTLNWTQWGDAFYTGDITDKVNGSIFICSKYPTGSVIGTTTNKIIGGNSSNKNVYVRDTDYTDATAFKTAMSGVLLCYELADPTQGNCIAVKTDDGSGIDGTMAVFETGTPLRGIPDTDIKDVMQWDGRAGTAVNVCSAIDLGTLNWTKHISLNCFYSTLSNKSFGTNNIICANYNIGDMFNYDLDKIIQGNMNNTNIYIRDTDYTDATAFKTAMSGVMLVYELATPTITPLTATENASIAGLRTYEPQTHAQNNAQTDMTVEAYAGTANGQAIADLKTELKITQSDTLTLTVAGWSNNVQVIAYAHDTAKRNVIDVDPESVEEWANCGVMATAETATSITFTCKTVPENALNFRVTSMGV